MPITPFLDGERLDLEGERLRVAFEMVCIGLRTGGCDDGVKQAIATKLIALARTGERNPDMLCEPGIEGYSHAATVGRFRTCAVFAPRRSGESSSGERDPERLCALVLQELSK